MFEVFFYQDEKGKSEVLDYILELSAKRNLTDYRERSNNDD